MIRAQLVFAFLAVMAEYPYPSKAQVPGFQGSVNNYGVGMNPDEGCRHPPNGKPACSQWFRFKFQAFNDGTVQAPFAITNDSLRGYCGAVTFVVRDRANPPGKILGTFKSARYCIAGKGADTNYHERRAEVQWTFQTNPAVGQLGVDLYGYAEDYKDIGVNWSQIIPAGDIITKVAEAVITAAASQ
jgi:hypothetical protein